MIGPRSARLQLVWLTVPDIRRQPRKPTWKGVGMFRRSLLAAATASLAVSIAPKSWSQTGPTGPVKIIVPYAPNGSADIYARMLAGHLTKRLHQPLEVENMP